MNEDKKNHSAQTCQPDLDPLSRLKSRCEAVIYDALTSLGIGIRKDYAANRENLNGSQSALAKRRP